MVTLSRRSYKGILKTGAVVVAHLTPFEIPRFWFSYLVFVLHGGFRRGVPLYNVYVDGCFLAYNEQWGG